MPGPRHEGKPPSSVSEIAALAKEFEAHRPRLLAMLRRRIDPALPPRLDPEDILGEAFLRARVKWSDHDPAVISVYAWLYRIGPKSVSLCAVKRFRSSRGNHAPRQLGRSSRKLSERRWR
jgi:hypothetical protein